MGLHGGNIREVTSRYGLSGKDVIDFSASINPLGFPGSLKKIISDNFASVPCYPDPDCQDLRSSLAEYLSIPENNLLAGNGSIELIYLITLALKPKRALIPAPTFSEYERAVLSAGGKCVFLNTPEKNGFKINASQILKNLSRVDLVFLCNPNNPTGFLFDEETIAGLAKECEKRGVFLVVDEVFMDFVEEKEKVSLLKFASKSNYVMVLRSLTKFFAISALRLGILGAGERLLKKIQAHQYPWSVNSFAQSAGAGLLKEKGFIAKSRSYMFKQREELFSELNRIKYIKPYPANANFIFCKILDKKITSAALCNYCGRKGIIIRDCSNFRGLDDSFIRVAVRKKEENAKLIKVLWQKQ